MDLKPFKVGLILGGGGARGLAHVGILSVFEKEGIPVNIISGASMGAIIGGIYAQNPDAQQLRERVVKFIKGDKFRELGVNNFRKKNQQDPEDILSQLTQRVKRRLVINLAANRISLLKADRLLIAVKELIHDNLIEDCKIPFACVAADLRTGTEVTFKSGKMRKAIAGSSSIPGFLPPVEYNGYLLTDGSVINNFPVYVVREMGADLNIVINVSLGFEENTNIDNVVDLIMRSGQITSRKLNELLQKDGDVVISPDIGHIHWSEFMRIDEIINLGEQAAREAIPQIKKLIFKRKRFLYRLFNRSKNSKS